MSKKRVLLIIAVEIVILILTAVYSLVRFRSNHGLIVDPATSYSQRASLEDGIWHVDTASLTDTESAYIVLETTALDLQQGSYKAVIEYDTDHMQQLNMSCDGSYMRYYPPNLYPNHDRMEYRFELTRDGGRNIQMVFIYLGGSRFDIGSIIIYPTLSMWIRHLVELVAIMLLFNILVMCGNRSWYKGFVKVFAAAFLISIPFFIGGVNAGHDYIFHSVRLEGIAEALKSGEFPVRMQSFWMDGYGYPVSIYYGDILMYIPAVLRILGFFNTQAYLIFVFMINLITVSIAYFSFSKVFNSDRIGFLLAIVYATSNYRLVDIYVRASVGEYCAMAFLPLIALALHGIYMGDTTDKKTYRKNALYLAFGMTGILESHMLTTEMVVIVMFVICLVFIRRTVRLETLITFASAVAMTVVLNLGFLVPFLDYYINVPVNITDNMSTSDASIYASAIYPGQYFAFFQTIFGTSDVYAPARLSLTPGLILMLALIAGWIMWIYNRNNRRLLTYLILSTVLMYIASSWFPWDSMLKLGAFGSLMCTIQFPWRYLSIIVLCITLVLGEILSLAPVISEKKNERLTESVLLVAVFVTTGVFASNYIDNAELVSYIDKSGIPSNYIMVGEYLLSGVDGMNLSYDITSENASIDGVFEREGCKGTIPVTVGEGGGWVEVPIFDYKGYHAVDDAGNELEIQRGDNGRIRIMVADAYSGNIRIDFVEPVTWRIAEVLTFIAWAVLIVLLLDRGYFGKKKEVSEQESVA